MPRRHFPEEGEVLFPPLTFLKPTGESHAITIDDAQFTVVEVEPRM